MIAVAALVVGGVSLSKLSPQAEQVSTSTTPPPPKNEGVGTILAGNIVCLQEEGGDYLRFASPEDKMDDQNDLPWDFDDDIWGIAIATGYKVSIYDGNNRETYMAEYSAEGHACKVGFNSGCANAIGEDIDSIRIESIG